MKELLLNQKKSMFGLLNCIGVDSGVGAVNRYG